LAASFEETAMFNVVVEWMDEQQSRARFRHGACRCPE
jgi:hypothetical protein